MSFRLSAVCSFTANSIKVVLPKAQTVNYERAGDDGLLPIFTSKLGIISLKQLNLLIYYYFFGQLIYLLQR